MAEEIARAPGRRFDVIPALDLLGGRVVRLRQGDYDAVTVFDADPMAAVRRLWSRGAASLHVVDLDAARSGSRPLEHAQLIARICAFRPEKGVVQVGGGFRTTSGVADAVGLGVDRVIVGTAAFADRGWLRTMVAEHGPRIVVSADSREGTVRVAGWRDDTGLDVVDTVRSMTDDGVRGFLVTAIDRDGTGDGPDLRLMERLRAATDVLLLASGGVGSAGDVRRVRETGADGVVVGRALLDGSITLEEALAAGR